MMRTAAAPAAISATVARYAVIVPHQKAIAVACGLLRTQWRGSLVSPRIKHAGGHRR